MKKYLELKSLILSAELDARKFYEKGNNNVNYILM